MRRFVINANVVFKFCVTNILFVAVFFPSICLADSLYFSVQPTQSLKFNKDLTFANIELILSDNNLTFEQKAPRFRPEISLFTSHDRSKSYVVSDYISPTQKKYNRYKNSIPTVYRLTLKGYSVMEYSNNKADTWSLNKIKHRAFRKPEIMFSVTKNF